VGAAPTKPLPAPPKSFTAKHGGPIKPKVMTTLVFLKLSKQATNDSFPISVCQVDMSTPVSMAAPSSRHNRAARPQSQQQRTADKKFEPVLKPDLRNEGFRPSYDAKGEPVPRKNPSVARNKDDDRWLEDGVDESMMTRMAEIAAELEQSRQSQSVIALAQRHAASATLQRQREISSSYKAEAKEDKDFERPVEKESSAKDTSSKYVGENKQGRASESPPLPLMLEVAPDKPGQACIEEDREGEGNGFGLQLDIGSIKKEAADRNDRFQGGGGGDGWVGARASGAYELSASGTFVVDKFTIRRYVSYGTIYLSFSCFMFPLSMHTRSCLEKVQSVVVIFMGSSEKWTQFKHSKLE
jgi:hypothetical protein